MAPGDLDADGDEDLVVAFWGQTNEIWLNDGTGSFHRVRLAEVENTVAVALGDIDGDGDNDIVTSLWAHGWGLAWFENELEEGKVHLVKHELMPQEEKPGVGGVTAANRSPEPARIRERCWYSSTPAMSFRKGIADRSSRAK